MTRLSLKIVMSLILLGVLVFAMTAPALAAGPQEWYLESTGHPVTGMVMTKTWGVASGEVTIAAGGSQLWLADEAAQVDVVFPEGAWVITLKTDGNWQDIDNCRVVMGEWEIAASTFNPFSTSEQPKITWDGDKYIMAVLLETAPATVREHNYLALKVTNDDSNSHTVYTDGESSMKSPDSDPGYPFSKDGHDGVPTVPALSQWGMISAAMLFAGLLVWKARRRLLTKV